MEVRIPVLFLPKLTTVVPGTIKFQYNSASTNPFTYTKDGRENTRCEKKFQIKTDYPLIKYRNVDIIEIKEK